MAGAQWLEVMYRHIPDRNERRVRVVGLRANQVCRQRAADDTHMLISQDQRGCAVITGFDLGYPNVIKK